MIGNFAGRVERSDHRAVEADQRAHGRSRHDRFVQMHHVGLEAAQRLRGPARGRATR